MIFQYTILFLTCTVICWEIEWVSNMKQIKLKFVSYMAMLNFSQHYFSSFRL